MGYPIANANVIPGRITGDVRVAGVAPYEVELAQAGKIAASVFRNPRTQFFSTDVLSEMAFGAANHQVPRDEILARIDAAAAELGLTVLLDRTMNELSGGERQCVACASALVSRPQVYLLDDPTANLDVHAALTFAHRLMELKKHGATIIIAEHRLSYLHGLIDRVIEMREGRIFRDRPGCELWGDV